MANEQAFTGTPDTSSGYPIDVASGNAGAGVVKRQRIAIGDPQFVNPDIRPTAAGALPVDGSGVTQPISGTVAVNNFPATQPVSGTVAETVADGAKVNQGTNADAAVTGDTAGTLSAKLRGLSKILFDVWNAATHVLQVAVVGSVSVIQGSAFLIKDSTGLSITSSAKGVAAASLLNVQEAKDTGRTYVTLRADLVAGVTTEALVTFIKNVNGTDTAAQTAYTITNGKTFRIQSLSYEILNTTTVANRGRATVRVAGSVGAASPVVAKCAAHSQAALAASGAFNQVDFPDGIDIPGNGTIQIGISHLESVTTAAIVSIILVGYEY